MSDETLEDARLITSSCVTLMKELEEGTAPFSDAAFAQVENALLDAARIIKSIRDKSAYAAKNRQQSPDVLAILEQPINGALLLKIEAVRLDASVAEEFMLRISEYLRNGHTKLILDMGNITFMDSRGLGALILCAKLAGIGNLVLYDVSIRVQSLFQLTRMNDVIRMYADKDSALNFLHQGSLDGRDEASRPT